MDSIHDQIREGFATVNARLDGIDGRVRSTEVELGRTDTRLAHLEKEKGRLEEQHNALMSGIEDMRNRLTLVSDWPNLHRAAKSVAANGGIRPTARESWLIAVGLGIVVCLLQIIQWGFGIVWKAITH